MSFVGPGISQNQAARQLTLRPRPHLQKFIFKIFINFYVTAVSKALEICTLIAPRAISATSGKVPGNEMKIKK